MIWSLTERGNWRKKSKHMVVKKAIFCSLWLGMDGVPSGFCFRLLVEEEHGGVDGTDSRVKA